MKYYRLREIAKKLDVDRKVVYYWKKLKLIKVEKRLGLLCISHKEFKKLRALIRNR